MSSSLAQVQRAAALCLDLKANNVVALDLERVSNATDFLRPHRSGRLQVVAVPIQQGRTQQLWQVEIRRPEDGKLVARGQVRLQNVPA